jgi:nitrate reductase NapAB chaperone NapD
MPVKSYLVRPHAGKFNELIAELSALKGCEIIPSTNEEITVLVTDTLNEEEDILLVSKINTLDSLKMLTMVSGFEVNT